MFDFQIQTISTSLVLAGDECVRVDQLAGILKTALEESDDAVITTQTDMLDGVTVRTAGLTLRAGWHHEGDERRLSLSIGGSDNGGFGGDRAMQIRLTRVLRHVLDALPVEGVEWLDTGVCIPADRFRAALEPLARLDMKVAPRRVRRDAKSVATRLSAEEARKVIRAAERPLAPLPAMKVAPRRVSAERPGATRRLTQADAARIAARVPEVTEADRITATAGIAPQHDDHIRSYEAHRITDLRRDATPEELAALRMEQDGPVAMRLAASLLLGLTGAFTVTQSSEAVASVLGAS
ncbi:hypothetical protein SAMN05216196_101252 [Lutimaribacter pacificus]|uniref:Uncharacterized protein n=1 Tax=Lutimaribacter pacificus TaxID=391948 RepID=A0A1H0APZ1_9RHOB|nr:hypothetical protein [Lutimaribacter pacificus]SDN35459.1 hypothetical protein SAMN05216196_101252 [Lutimaribacter pacificus]SHJ66449.1 hypothetical protein SAMN05444142_101965 [Lutimaribacter pacificus]